ncbi:type VI secretion protein, partial [Streptomyces virginiae]|uniref:type VI secretion protein n=1 Tax=Streptomyces virginiae TaxID=1961 RepID=UPI0036117776
VPAPPAFEARGFGGSAPAVPAPPAFETRGSGGSAPAVPAPPAFETRGSGGSAPATHTGPTDDAYRYGFGYAPGPAATTVTPALAPHGITYGGPDDRHRVAAHRIAETEGAALVVTSSPALWAETKDARAKLGPVLLYDPSHLCDTPARMHWNPAEGCADRDTAAARAVALLTPVRPQARMDEAVADTAETLLRSWLQAAALDDRPFKQLHRWTQGNSGQDPVRILRTHPQAAAGAAGELESALTAHPERRELALNLTARALSCLTSIHIREACNPNRTDALTLASFVAEGGTLYLVGEALEDPRTHPGAMPLLTALASHVVEHGRRMAARSSHGRLDPPLSLVLDDVAAVAPIPQLPELLTGDTLPLLALCRSREQARSRWPGADL